METVAAANAVAVAVAVGVVAAAAAVGVVAAVAAAAGAVAAALVPDVAALFWPLQLLCRRCNHDSLRRGSPHSWNKEGFPP